MTAAAVISCHSRFFSLVIQVLNYVSFFSCRPSHVQAGQRRQCANHSDVTSQMTAVNESASEVRTYVLWMGCHRLPSRLAKRRTHLQRALTQYCMLQPYSAMTLTFIEGYFQSLTLIYPEEW